MQEFINQIEPVIWIICSGLAVTIIVSALLVIRKEKA